jgi:hypothetical protein
MHQSLWQVVAGMSCLTAWTSFFNIDAKAFVSLVKPRRAVPRSLRKLPVRQGNEFETRRSPLLNVRPESPTFNHANQLRNFNPVLCKYNDGNFGRAHTLG